TEEEADQKSLPIGSVTETREPAAASNKGRQAGKLAAIAETIEALRKKGFGRLLVDGRAIPFDAVDGQAVVGRSVLQVVVDRVQLGTDDQEQRLTDSIETAYREGGGAAWAEQLVPPSPAEGTRASSGEAGSASNIVHVFSERFEC